MRVIEVRQEGTVSSGRLLFVDLETEGRFGPIEVSYQLDYDTGVPLDNGYVDSQPMNRKPTPEELLLLAQAFNQFQAENQPKPLSRKVAFLDRNYQAILENAKH